MRCSWGGQPPLRKVKEAIFIGQVMNVVSAEEHRPFGALFLALIRSPLVFPFILLPFSFIFLSVSCLIVCSRPLSVTFFLSFSPCLLPSVSLTQESIVIDFISLSALPLPPHFLPPCLSLHSGSAVADPDLKVTCWLGQGLQHRTWVLPLLPARVLCCSQWSSLSRLSARLSDGPEPPEQMDPANHGPADPRSSLYSCLITVIRSVVFKINILSSFAVKKQ